MWPIFIPVRLLKVRKLSIDFFLFLTCQPSPVKRHIQTLAMQNGTLLKHPSVMSLSGWPSIRTSLT